MAKSDKAVNFRAEKIEYAVGLLIAGTERGDVETHVPMKAVFIHSDPPVLLHSSDPRGMRSTDSAQNYDVLKGEEATARYEKIVGSLDGVVQPKEIPVPESLLEFALALDMVKNPPRAVSQILKLY
ncbi:hypothetical protein HY497_01840 [Candidatus Woesearchaeota archaeon]|nr:hypothetical protein [Candidatus Woesearchaeota archaeon]